MNLYFYTTRGRYGCFSNFSPHAFELDSRHWRTVEHYYQAQKFWGMPFSDIIQRAATAVDAKRLGRSQMASIRPDWERVKDDVMLKAVSRKFATHHNLQRVLLSTGDAVLIEASPTDYYWGCGANGTGRNRLGQILMQVRHQLKEESVQMTLFSTTF